MNKRAFGIVALSALAVAALAAPVGAASAPKTTGDVWADRTDEGTGAGVAHMVFVAQATTPAKGTFTYSDNDGAYTINVQAVRIDGPVGHFAGPIVSSTRSENVLQVGGFVGIVVRDGGEPGIGVDKIDGAGYPTLEDAVAAFATLQPVNLTASAGNLQVR
jgi:hypothetical protein